METSAICSRILNTSALLMSSLRSLVSCNLNAYSMQGLCRAQQWALGHLIHRIACSALLAAEACHEGHATLRWRLAFPIKGAGQRTKRQGRQPQAHDVLRGWQPWESFSQLMQQIQDRWRLGLPFPR